MKPIICWWSGGITSAVACKIAIDLYGKDRCKVVMIDTGNEDVDTYRFREDCQKWYGVDIHIITGLKTVPRPGIHQTYVDIGYEYKSIQDVWMRYKSLNVAHGAICSTELKRTVREKYQKTQEYDHQVFGFEFDKKEFNRAMSLSMNHAESKPIFPLLLMGYDKDVCASIVQQAGIEVPNSY
jgi:hypothetical protein